MAENVRYTTLAEELAAKHMVTCYTVGTSMQPLLIERKTHAIILSIGEVQKNDILLYLRSNGAYVLHRLIKEDSHYYYMRGDNTYGLEPIRKEQAIGVVTRIYRKGSYIDVGNTHYRRYVAFWNAIYPVRWLFWRAKAVGWRLLSMCKAKR